MGKYKIYITSDGNDSVTNEQGMIKAHRRGIGGEVIIKLAHDDSQKHITSNYIKNSFNPLNIKDELPSGIQARFNTIINDINNNENLSQKFSYIGSYINGKGLDDGYTTWGEFVKH